ncbi:50S ribosomal protein L26e [Fonticula alba]|uniref:50S ribosomal protein L26e n=1 Tax=Fonticula alba TaxID=691883 RepID=A0A058ZEU7_FONAL|nr:50S ribosomal protein L26e [Fonticula alba]KCV72448.1 50S ribosomal protein L26e [Fonticula alba]|eukprot:XP_009492149.1 50S ribosomal protein L26e [Fonticula alba]
MKFSKDVSSSRRKCRKAHFTAPSHARRLLMSSALSKELRASYGIRSLPIRRNDVVTIKTGQFKGISGKVVKVYRLKMCVYVEGASKKKADESLIPVPIDASNLQITQLHLDKNREKLLKVRAAGKAKEQTVA